MLLAIDAGASPSTLFSPLVLSPCLHCRLPLPARLSPLS